MRKGILQTCTVSDRYGPDVLAGPVLLEDYEVQEKLFSLNRERIPERIVHAKGAVAKGYFEVRMLLLVTALA